MLSRIHFCNWCKADRECRFLEARGYLWFCTDCGRSVPEDPDPVEDHRGEAASTVRKAFAKARNMLLAVVHFQEYTAHTVRMRDEFSRMDTILKTAAKVYGGQNTGTPLKDIWTRKVWKQLAAQGVPERQRSKLIWKRESIEFVDDVTLRAVQKRIKRLGLRTPKKTPQKKKGNSR